MEHLDSKLIALYDGYIVKVIAPMKCGYVDGILVEGAMDGWLFDSKDEDDYSCDKNHVLAFIEPEYLKKLNYVSRYRFLARHEVDLIPDTPVTRVIYGDPNDL